MMYKTLRSLQAYNPFVVLLLLGWLSASCLGPTPSKVIDLTYPFDDKTIYWPNNKPFQWEKIRWGTNASGHWYASGAFSASEHGGTHLDAPIHFAETGKTLDQIPLEKLIGPAIVIDISAQAHINPDYELQMEDVQAWEAEHGPIAPGTLVLLRTGWGRYWSDKTRYLGSSKTEDYTTFHFPGYSAASVRFLLSERGIRGIGIDTASIDAGHSTDFPVHRIVGEANVYGLENVAALDQLPPRGAHVTALPIKIRGGSGGPVRIMATIPY